MAARVVALGSGCSTRRVKTALHGPWTGSAKVTVPSSETVAWIALSDADMEEGYGVSCGLARWKVGALGLRKGFPGRECADSLRFFGDHQLRGGLFVDLPGGGTQFLEEAIEKLEIAARIPSRVGFDGVFNGDEADEEFAFRGGLVQLVPTDLPYVFGEVIDPLIFFLFEVQWFGRAAFEVSHDTTKGGFDGGVGWVECCFSCSPVVGPDLAESPDGHLKSHHEVVEVRVLHDDLLTHGGGGWGLRRGRRCLPCSSR